MKNLFKKTKIELSITEKLYILFPMVVCNSFLIILGYYGVPINNNWLTKIGCLGLVVGGAGNILATMFILSRNDAYEGNDKNENKH